MRVQRTGRGAAREAQPVGRAVEVRRRGFPRATHSGGDLEVGKRDSKSFVASELN